MSQYETFEGEPTTMNAPARIKSPLVEIAGQVERQKLQWQQALPPHISIDHFQRVVMTAIQINPKLVEVDRRSLWLACTQAAQDGLLPDGREGAIVPFKGKGKWMPMVAGLFKKMRNTGEITTIVARVVDTADDYDYWLDEEGEHIKWRPAITPNGQVRCVFAMAKTRDGSLYVEPMSLKEIERVRASSPSGQDRDAPWVNWWDEMAKKTAIRRMSKRLPSAPDLERAFHRDDDLYDLKTIRSVDEAAAEAKPVKSLDDFAKAAPTNGRKRKAEPEAKPRRGRPRKVEADAEPERPEWFVTFKEKIGEAISHEGILEAWEGISDEFEEAPDELKAEASDLYNHAMDRIEETAGEQE